MPLKLNGSTSGSATVQAAAVAGLTTLTLPTTTGNLLGDGTATGTGNPVLATSPTITSPSISGAIMSSMASSVITSGTLQASTSGTSIDFTGIPSWAKRVTVMFNGVSTSGTSVPLIQIGNGTIQTTGYLGAASICSGGATTNNNYTTGFGAGGVLAANILYGSFILTLVDLSTNTWVINGVVGGSSSAFNVLTGGGKSLTSALDRVRITTVNGTDTFDAGSINILYE